MIGTTSSGTLIVLFGMYVVYVHTDDPDTSNPHHTCHRRLTSHGERVLLMQYPARTWMMVFVGPLARLDDQQRVER